METNVKAIELRDIWRRYKATGDPHARERLVVAYSPLVKYVSGRMASGLPAHVDEADLISYGLVGLINAIERFEPAREIKFDGIAADSSLLPKVRAVEAALDEEGADAWRHWQQQWRARVEQLALDFVAVNGENAAAGFGITSKICAELHEAGVDCITTGNHVWDQREIMPYIAQDKRLLRPLNFPPGTPGWGANLFQTTRGQKIVVIGDAAKAGKSKEAIGSAFEAALLGA